jgi:prepilin-type N-terminal cleavage/methylation domain-containing protein
LKVIELAFILNMKSIDRDNKRKVRGFTLIEIIIALAITGIVLVLAGSGLFALMNANQRSQIETADRLELEQALSFMTDEIKMSQYIATSLPVKSNSESSRFRSASGSSKIQTILILNPPPSSGLTDPIVYYLANPPSRSVWIGSRVIYRWGPTLLQNGNYSDGRGRDLSTIARGSAVQYYNEVVVDRMGDRISTEPNTSCDNSSDLAIPNIADRLGFYTCISTDRKSVKIWMYKQSDRSAKSQSVNALVSTRSN